ncbi:hypothetical protein [Arsenicicoccus dermatophilus]|uniref:hypothetical protein n=1 Tax=Arsenicicoccus dermatophilus TaxID=1076331 RepID=UPI003916FBE6
MTAQGTGNDPQGEGAAELVEHAQLAAGILTARHRGDRGSAVMLASTADLHELLGGALLLAELLAGLYADACGQDPADCLSDLAVQLEASVPRADHRPGA